MKKLIIAFIALSFLVGCGTTDQTPEVKTPPVVKETPDINPNLEEVTTIPMDGAAEGEICGGTKAAPCGKGLTCVFDVTSAEGAGVCKDAIVDKEVQCPETQQPLCGMKFGQKNAYLNKCQLDRYGAEFVSEGLCKPDPEVKGSCEAKAVSIGTCFATQLAYEFDGTNCVKKHITGCAADIPFETMEACTTACK